MPVRHKATTWTLYGCFSASPQHPHHKCTGDTYIALLPQAVWIYKLIYDIDVSNLLHINSTHMGNFMVTYKIIINTDSVLVPDRHQPGHCPHTMMLMVLGKTAASPFLMDSFHIWYKWSLAWEGVSHVMTFDLDLYLEGHSTLILKILSAL